LIVVRRVHQRVAALDGPRARRMCAPLWVLRNGHPRLIIVPSCFRQMCLWSRRGHADFPYGHAHGRSSIDRKS